MGSAGTHPCRCSDDEGKLRSRSQRAAQPVAQQRLRLPPGRDRRSSGRERENEHGSRLHRLCCSSGGTLSIKDFAERNTGAAFNWWQFGKSFKDGKTIGLGDPAAYVHNPTYARQVIKDSIDWLDDFPMNNSVTAAPIDAQAAHPVKTYGGVADGVAADAAKAKAYLGL